MSGGSAAISVESGRPNYFTAGVEKTGHEDSFRAVFTLNN